MKIKYILCRCLVNILKMINKDLMNFNKYLNNYIKRRRNEVYKDN